jgi:hypothetical protein
MAAESVLVGRTETIDGPLLPVRMLNEFAYCPRLGYLMWVQGEFADSADTFRSWAVPGGRGNQVTSDE